MGDVSSGRPVVGGYVAKVDWTPAYSGVASEGMAKRHMSSYQGNNISCDNSTTRRGAQQVGQGGYGVEDLPSLLYKC